MIITSGRTRLSVATTVSSTLTRAHSLSSAAMRCGREVFVAHELEGRSFQQIREQYYKTVRPMHLQFVEPSKRYADLIIPEGAENEVALEAVVARIRAILAR